MGEIGKVTVIINRLIKWGKVWEKTVRSPERFAAPIINGEKLCTEISNECFESLIEIAHK